MKQLIWWLDTNFVGPSIPPEHHACHNNSRDIPVPFFFHLDTDSVIQTCGSVDIEYRSVTSIFSGIDSIF